MGYWQLRRIEANTLLASDAATYKVELPTSNIMSGLLVRMQWTNGSSGGGGEDIIDAVDKIEVIRDGSEVLFSLTGIEAAKVGHFMMGKPIPHYRNDNASVVQWAYFPIFFGRYFKDPNYWLNCARATSLDLKVTYSPTISAACFASGTGRIEVDAWMYLDGQPGDYKGTFKTHRIKQFTSAASGDKEVEFTRKYPLYRVYVYAYEAGVAEGTDITDVSFELNDGEKVIRKGRWVDIQALNTVEMGLETALQGVALRADNETIETRCGRINYVALTCEEDLAAEDDRTLVNVASISGGQITLSMVTIEGSGTWAAGTLQTTDKPIHWVADGGVVGNTICFPFDIMLGMDNLLNTAVYDSVDLVLTQGGAGAEVDVLVQEVLPA